MGGKKGGGQRTPYIAPNTLESKQKIKLVHLLSAGVMSGWRNGNLLKSIKFNDTYVQNADGSFNFNNVQANYLAGDLDQDYLAGFDGIEKTISVGAQVKKNTPVTRTITDPLVGALRVTLGVPALFRQTDQGDMYGTNVDVSVQIIKNDNIYTSKLWSLNEKGNSNFKEDVVIDDLPEAPFDLKIVRLTADSNDDRLKNDTFFHSYVEVVPQKLSYPTLAVVGLELDAEQLGGQVPTVNYDVKGREIQVPSNYDPETRTYTGLWDGSFKTAFSNNPAWVLYDLLTDEIHGMGRHFNESIIDKMKLYEIGKYADEMVDDGQGGKEPRYVFNGLIQGNDAMTVIDNVCSVFRGRAVEKNGFISFIYDKGNQAPVATYTNANVIDGLFRYTHAPLDTRVNSVHFEYADERDGCKLKVEEVSDQASIAKLGRINTQKITCYGQTKRSAALRQATWFLQTSATESESVTFAVGFEGIKHGAFDIIAIADNHKAGVSIGGRITDIDGDKVTLDRDIFDAKEIRIREKLYKVKAQIEPNIYQLDKNITEPVYSVFSTNTDRATERLFKVISTEENEDGSYTISAVKYNAQKMGNVDDSISEYPEITTSYNTVPVLDSASVSNQGDYILLTWDTLSSSGTEIEYTVQLFKDGRAYQTHTTKEPSLKLYNLPMGEYEARIKGRTKLGVYSKEIVIAFSTTYIIQNLTYKPIVFGFELSWQNPPLITSNAKVEVWCSDEDKADNYRKFATIAYPQSTHIVGNLSAGDELYCKVRIVDDKLNYGEFTAPVLAKASTDSDDLLSYLQDQITTKEISSDAVDEIIEQAKKEIDFEDVFDQESIDKIIADVVEKIDPEGIIDSAVEEMRDNIDAIVAESETISNVVERADQTEIDLKLLELSKVTGDRAVHAETQVNRSTIDNNYAEMILQRITEATSDKQLASQYLSLVAQNEIAKAEYFLSQMSQATNDKALTKEIRSLTASFLGNEAQITELREVFATEKEAVAQSIDRLTTSVDDNKSSIENVKRATSDLEKSTATSVENLHSEIDDVTADAKLSKLSQVTGDSGLAGQQLSFKAQRDQDVADFKLSQVANVTSDKALAQQILTLNSTFKDSYAQIDEVKQTIADVDKATANSISKLETKVGENSAKVTQHSTAIANVDGTVKSQYTLTTEAVGAGGQKVVSGFTSINDGKTSEFIVQADKFAIVNKQNGETKTPFVVVDNKLGMDGDIIATGSISGNKLVAGTSIQAPIIKGGRVESGHFAGGSINIGNGNFSVDSNGNLIAKSGRFEGTVYADKIEGDIVTISTFDRNYNAITHQFTIQPENFDRLLIIENIQLYDVDKTGQGADMFRETTLYINDVEKWSVREIGDRDIPFILDRITKNKPVVVRIICGVRKGVPSSNFKVRGGLITIAKTRDL